MAQNPTPLQTSLGAAPAEGPMVVPYFLDFTSTNTQTVDLTLLQQRGNMSMVQTIFVDNSTANAPLQMVIANTQQSIKISAGAQAYVPIFVTNKLSITFYSSSQTVVYIGITNIPMSAAMWSATGVETFDTSGALIVSDPVLRSAVASGYFNSLQFSTMSGGTVSPVVRGNSRKMGTIANTSQVNVLVGAPGFVIKNLLIVLSPVSTFSTPVSSNVFIREATNTIAYAEFACPTSIPSYTLPTGPTNIIKWENMDFTSQISASTLSIQTSVPFSTGGLYYEVGYALTNFVGG